MPIRVVIADDHALLLQGLVALLLEAAPDIALLEQASDGEAAWTLIETLRPDVAVLDISMPGYTGIELARKTCDAQLPTRILLLTMHADPTVFRQARSAGAAGYVLKDSSFEELADAVRAVAAGGTFVAPAVANRARVLERQGGPDPMLSPRELEVLHLIALGVSSREIAKRMAVSPRTVETYRKRLMAKIGVHSIAELVRYAVRSGLVG